MPVLILIIERIIQTSSFPILSFLINLFIIIIIISYLHVV